MNRHRRPSPRRLDLESARGLTLDPGAWLSCDDCFDRVDAAVDALVLRGADLEPSLRSHLFGCPACCEEARSLATLVAETAGLDPAAALERLDGDLASPQGR